MDQSASSPDLFMRRALTLAKRGLGCVEPNPMVGCVLVRKGRILAEGWHHRYGGAHAEVDALARCRAAGADPRGCDAHVTLEPCNHHGKTPPCSEALIDAGVRRVFVAMRDPNPSVKGGGITRLRRAGIEVNIGLCSDEAMSLNEAYVKRVTTGLPWVIAKWAQTVDGRTATSSGDSRWISGAVSRRRVHELRARVDAIMVGIGTVLADDPLLTARDVTTVRRVARRVVVDPMLRLPTNAAMIRSMREGGPGITISVGSRLSRESRAKRAKLEAVGVELVALPTWKRGSRHLALDSLLRHLVDVHQATNVLTEGGAGLHGSLFAQDLVDQALVFVAPKVVGDGGVPALRGVDVKRMDDAMAMRLAQVKRVGEDVMLEYRAKPQAATE